MVRTATTNDLTSTNTFCRHVELDAQRERERERGGTALHVSLDSTIWISICNDLVIDALSVHSMANEAAERRKGDDGKPIVQ